MSTEMSSRITLLDGSMGLYLGNHSPLFEKIWCAAALAEPEHNEKVIQAHMEYIKAGSTIICTNTYSVNPYLYSNAFGEDIYEEHMLKHATLAAKLANDARNRSPMDNVRIFGALGPICESYQREMFNQYMIGKGRAFCISVYEKLSRALYEGGVDGFIIETMNSWDEARISLEGVKKMKSDIDGETVSLPIIVSLQGSFLNTEFKPSPEELASNAVQEFIKYFDENPKLDIIAFGLNCASPEDTINSFEWIFKSCVQSKDDKNGDLSAESVENAFNRRNISLCTYPNIIDIQHSDEFDTTKDGYVFDARHDMVTNDYKEFCDVIGEFITRFNVKYIGACCGSDPRCITKLYEEFVKS